MTGAKLKENVIVRGIIYFEVPPLNFDSEVYYDMVDWQRCIIAESPITKAISDEDLEKLVLSEETEVVDFLRFSCHTQAVEGCVKAIIESSVASLDLQLETFSFKPESKLEQ